MAAYGIEDDDVDYAEVHRNLADPVYRIRRFGLRLTETDMMVCAAMWYAVWTVIGRMGVGNVSVLGKLFTLDPFAPLAALLIGAYGFSIMHLVRPELSLDKLLKRTGGGLASCYAARLPDRDPKWRANKVGRALAAEL